MTEETPEFGMGDFDWRDLEYAANNDGSVEGAPQPQTEQRILTPEMVAKRVTWNVAPHDHAAEISAYMGLPAVSDEILEKEHDEAHLRLQEAAVLLPAIHMLAVAAARSILATMVVMNEVADGIEMDSEDFNESAEKLEAVLFEGTVSTFVELMDWGLLHTPHILSPEQFIEYQRIIKEQEEQDETE